MSQVEQRYLVILLFLLIFIYDIDGAPIKCSYEIPRLDDVVIAAEQRSNSAGRKSLERHRLRRHRRQLPASAYSFYPLKIKPFYDNSVNKLTLEEQQYVKTNLLPEAMNFWQSALKVRRTSTSGIVLARKCRTAKQYVLKAGGRRKCAGGCREETKCGEVVVPDEHLESCFYCLTNNPTTCGRSQKAGVGVPDADFVLYVSVVQSARCRKADTVAYAAHCELESILDRPIAGHMNICPSSLSTDHKEREVLISTVKHEILHALGFSVALYAFFRDATGKPRTKRNRQGLPVHVNSEKGIYQWSQSIIRDVTRHNWWTGAGPVKHTVSVLSTPTVLREVRGHFGCTRLEGAELENQGGDGTVLTHWEKRLFENEAMTGSHTQNPVYSRLTFALLEDSGWLCHGVLSAFSAAQRLHWGHELGCEFAMQSCGEWISRKIHTGDVSPFCNQVKQFINAKSRPTREIAPTTCTDGRDSLALCNLIGYETALPASYQNFAHLRGINPNDTAHYGGSVELADYCPYNQEFEWRNDSSGRGRRRDSRCEFESNTPPDEFNAALETYGRNSRCFHHASTSWKLSRCKYTRTFRQNGAGCYRFRCSEGSVWIELLNGTAEYRCVVAGQLINVRRVYDGWLHEGTIQCPSCSDICNETDCVASSSTHSGTIDDPRLPVPCRSCRTPAAHFSTALLISYLAVWSAKWVV